MKNLNEKKILVIAHFQSSECTNFPASIKGDQNALSAGMVKNRILVESISERKMECIGGVYYWFYEVTLKKTPNKSALRNALGKIFPACYHKQIAFQSKLWDRLS